MVEPRRTMQGRLRLLLGGSGLVLAALIVAVVLVVQAFETDADRREALIPPATDASELSGILVAQLDALTSGESLGIAAAEEYQQARVRATVLLGRLEIQLRDETDLLDELGALRDELLAWQAQISLVAAESGTPVGSLGGAAVPPIQEQLTSLVGRAEALTRGITEAVDDASGQASDSRAILLWSILGAGVVAIGLLVVGAVELRRRVVVPVERLTAEVALVADGRLEAQVFADDTEELAQLADSVSRMRDRILSERDQAVRAVEAVDQQAPAVAALRTLLAPRLATPPPGLQVAGALLPAEGELAGDWYDFAAGDTQLVVSIGDVCGHGIDAGVLAVRTKFALLDAMDLHLDPARALDLASRRFVRTDTFVTAAVAEIDVARGECRYASAGHNPGLLLRADGSIEELHRTGPLIGLANGPRPNAYVRVGEGDLLVWYTDGVVEARDAKGDLLELDGLLDVLLDHPAEDPQRLADLVMGRVLAHCGGSCADDATIAVIRIGGGLVPGGLG